MTPLVRLIAWFLSMAAVLPLTASAAQFIRTEDVIYGRKSGTALTLDVLQPKENRNGYGIVFIISGGWHSSHEAINPQAFAVMLDRGYSVFAVVHGSQPKFTITEIVPDVHRAVRFIRLHAERWGVNADKLGISGGSAGGHLSLTMGTAGQAGDPSAKDPIDRTSSAVQAVACFFPPTDFLNYGKPGEDAVGVGILKAFKAAFGPRSDTPEGRQQLGREISPIYLVSETTAPSLIIHGDADELVPIQQAETFVQKAKKAGVDARLIIKPGAAHGWGGMEKDVEAIADWFDIHLRGIKAGD